MTKGKQHLTNEQLMNSVNARWVKARSLYGSYNRDDIDEGIRELEAALEVASGLQGAATQYISAEILKALGDMHVQIGDTGHITQGIKCHVSALEHRVSYYGNSANESIADSLHAIGNAYSLLCGKENLLVSKTHYDQELLVRRGLYTDTIHESVIECLIGCANSRLNDDDDNEAKIGLELLNCALKSSTVLYDNNENKVTAHILRCQGKYYSRYEDLLDLHTAISLNTKALGILGKTASLDCYLDKSSCLYDLAKLHHRLSILEPANTAMHIEKSIAASTEALAVCRIVYAALPHPNLTATLGLVCQLYVECGSADQLKQARTMLHELKELYVDLYSADHPKVIKCVNDLENVGKLIATQCSEIGEVGEDVQSIEHVHYEAVVIAHANNNDNNLGGVSEGTGLLGLDSLTCNHTGEE